MSLSIIADLHTHTRYSDGGTTIEQNVTAAHSLGLKYIAITDHGPAQLSSGIKRSDIPLQRKEVDRLNSHYAGEITALLGIEANIISLDGHIDVLPEYADLYDIVLMGFHKTARPSTITDISHFWVKSLLLNRSDKPNIKQLTTDAYIKAIENNRIDIIVHPRHNIDVDVPRLGRECARQGTALEISARRNHLQMTQQDASAARREGAFFVIDSDGHTVEEIGGFQQALDFAGPAGFGPEDIINADGHSSDMVNIFMK